MNISGGNNCVLENMEKTRPQIDIRRNPTGSFGMKANQALIKPLPLPNYLRASTGSCHDYCKYGIKCKANENVKTNNSTFQARKELMINQQKLKQQKAISPKRPDELKMETLKKEVSSKPHNRRYSDVCIQTRSFTNGLSNDVMKNSSKMAGGVPKTTTPSVKCDSKNASPKGLPQSKNKASKPPKCVSKNAPPKGLPQSKNKASKAKTRIDEQSSELPVEKILYVDEITPFKQHACGFAQEAVECLSMPEETEDKSYVNLKVLSLSIPQETEDMSYINVKSFSLSVPEETEDMSYIDVKAFSLSVSEETEDMSYINVKALSLSVPEETEDMSCINVEALSLSSDSLASATTISCEPDSNDSSRDIESKEDNNVDDQCHKYSQMIVNDECKSIETRNKSTKVVLRHWNIEEKRLPEAARKLEEARKIKVKALVSAFEALISLEDNKSSGTDINMILSPVQCSV